MNESDHCPKPMTVWLSLVTLSWIGSVFVAHRLGRELLALGEGSEEIFRGDRLPILNFPELSDENQANQSSH